MKKTLSILLLWQLPLLYLLIPCGILPSPCGGTGGDLWGGLASAQTAGDVEYKLEMGGAVGLVNYLGDYNSSLLQNQQPMGSLILRRVVNPYMALRADLSYGKLSGDYKSPNNYYPFGPEHQPITEGGEDSGAAVSSSPGFFSSSLYDLSCVYEYNFWPYGTGRDYHRAKRLAPYLFLGLGATVADTKLAGTVVTAHVPLGLGVKYKAADRLNLGLEWRMHFSLSDELDGVSDPYGIKSQGIFKNTDCYSMLKFTITYSMLPKCSTCNPSY